MAFHLRKRTAFPPIGLLVVLAITGPGTALLVPAAQAADVNNAAGSQGQAATPRLPVKAAANGRYLVDQKGKPFLVVGDSPWSLIVQPRESDIDRYLDDRAKRGFNAVLVNLIEHKFCTNRPNTRAGLAPFQKAGDFSTPNPRYFEFAYQVVKKANDRGILVWLCPAYLGSGGGDEGWFREMKASGPASVRGYARFVGKRFKDLPNIVWVLGGDFIPPKADQWTVTEVAAGILQEDATHLMTAHTSRGYCATDAYGDAKWLTVDTAYLSEKTLFRPMLRAYERRPPRPLVLIEYFYEGENNARAEDLRRQAYGSMLSGACGQFFGNCPLWHFDGPGLFAPKTTWQEALDGMGSRDMARLRDVFVRLPWHELVPEQNHAIVKDGYGKDAATTLTAQTADKKLSLTYVPSTGTQPREFTVDLGQFSGPVMGRWYNPTKGSSTAVVDAPLSNRGTRRFRTPGDNGTKTNDWLLMLKVRPR